MTNKKYFPKLIIIYATTPFLKYKNICHHLSFKKSQPLKHKQNPANHIPTMDALFATHYKHRTRRTLNMHRVQTAANQNELTNFCSFCSNYTMIASLKHTTGPPKNNIYHAKTSARTPPRTFSRRFISPARLHN